MTLSPALDRAAELLIQVAAACELARARAEKAEANLASINLWIELACDVTNKKLNAYNQARGKSNDPGLLWSKR